MSNAAAVRSKEAVVSSVFFLIKPVQYTAEVINVKNMQILVYSKFKIIPMKATVINGSITVFVSVFENIAFGYIILERMVYTIIVMSNAMLMYVMLLSE